MKWLELRQRISRLDLQAKVILVLVLVTAPIYLLVSFSVSQLTVPVIAEEMRVLGVHAARSLADHLKADRVLMTGTEEDIEQRLREIFYIQPNVMQVDVFRRTESGLIELAGSTEDAALAVSPPNGVLPEQVLSFQKKFDDGREFWEIWAPVYSRRNNIQGVVRVEISMQLAASLARAVSKIMIIAGAVNIFLLLFALSYFLRKTIANDRRLRQAEFQNLELSKQLREAERQVMIKEKLAVMGQLTASFAHEIGTPLNAVSGHLQLLQEDLRRAGDQPGRQSRLEIINEQLVKIENIVKGFLQSTAKPPSQYQLLDVNQVLEKTLAIVSPRIDSLGVSLEKSFDSKLGPLRAVPLDIEQVLLNLLTNSLDSIQFKQRAHPAAASRLEVFSRHRIEGPEEWVELGVKDSGEGIAKQDIEKVFKPFFTTKAAGEGTGLGLTICQEIAGKYRGKLEIDSREGVWTRVTLSMPYGGHA